jgi:secondary thiamine-phosphate synthase enzyme
MEIPVVSKKRCEALDATEQLQEACRRWGGTGALLVYCPHTTAGVTINEHADPDVMHDVTDTLSRMAPHGGPYSHSEGNSDAHIKSVLAGNQVVVPVRDGRLLLGRWQGVFFLEFDGPRNRTLWLNFLRGE